MIISILEVNGTVVKSKKKSEAKIPHSETAQESFAQKKILGNFSPFSPRPPLLKEDGREGGGTGEKPWGKLVVFFFPFSSLFSLFWAARRLPAYGSSFPACSGFGHFAIH